MAQRTSTEIPAISEQRGSSERYVLLADDHEVSRAVAARQLERMGLRVHTAENGPEILKALEKTSYDIVLLDCQMPFVDVFLTAQEIRQRDQGRRPTLIIAMTAHPLKDERTRCQQAGIDHCLSKPLKAAEVELAVASALPPVPPPPSASPSPSPIEMERLLDLSDGKRGEMAKLVQLYIKTISQQLRDLENAVRENRPEDVEYIAHSAAGSSSMVGMRAVVGPLRELESIAVRRNLSGAPRLLAEVRRAFERLQDLLESQHLWKRPAAASPSVHEHHLSP